MSKGNVAMDMDDAYSNGAYIDRAFEYPDRWTAAAADHRELEHMLGRARLNCFTPVDAPRGWRCLCTVGIGCSLTAKIGHISPPV
ncbi:MAG: hypothetical protein ACPGRD_03700 [Planktomarina sp.]